MFCARDGGRRWLEMADDDVGIQREGMKRSALTVPLSPSVAFAGLSVVLSLCRRVTVVPGVFFVGVG